MLFITEWVMPGPQLGLSLVALVLALAGGVERAHFYRQVSRRRRADALRARADAVAMASLTPEDRAWLREQGWDG